MCLPSSLDSFYRGVSTFICYYYLLFQRGCRRGLVAWEELVDDVAKEVAQVIASVGEDWVSFVDESF